MAPIILTVENVGKKIGHTVFLDPEDLEQLSNLSRKTGHSISALIREVVKEYIREKKK